MISAFPHTKPSGLGFDIEANGMTLRDYFAAKALIVLMRDYVFESDPYVSELIAKMAYQMADAMIKGRDK